MVTSQEEQGSYKDAYKSGHIKLNHAFKLVNNQAYKSSPEEVQIQDQLLQNVRITDTF